MPRSHRPSVTTLAALLLLVATAGAAATPPCRPCAGIQVDDPDELFDALAAEPRLQEEARLYVAWEVELDGSSRLADIDRLRELGATPWITALFRVPAPVTGNLEQLEAELEELARLAAAGGERGHLQIAWYPPEEATWSPAEFAYLLKRAAVAVTGSNAEARVIAGPLAADAQSLSALYGEEIAAYVDGIALAPGPSEGTSAAVSALAELDPGKPLVLDALAWPEDPLLSLARAAEAERAGFSVVFFELARPTAADLAPLKVLAREFQGDLSFDPYLQVDGAEGVWPYVRGEDLALRVIALAPPGSESLELLFRDTALKGPRRIDPVSGEESLVFGQARTEAGLLAPIDRPARVAVLRIERMTAAEIEGLEGLDERIEVTDERQMPVEEILRRLQAFEDSQARRLDHYQARNSMSLRFAIGTGGIQATYEGPFFFQQGEGFDWAWESFYFDGVRWRGKKPPEIPLIQPEKAAVLPLEITFTKEYRYRLRGTAQVEGRDCWVVDFEPVDPENARGLYQGTVWVDRAVYARVRTRALQLGLEGEVLSNEETVFFIPVDAGGQEASWGEQTYVLPLRIVSHQVLSLLNAPVQLEIETRLSELEINAPGFAAARDTVLSSDVTMVRDTDQGLRYLVKDDEGNREVELEEDVSRLFLAGGVFWNEAFDYPIPLVGVNYLSFDFRGSGNQLNLFFAGPLLTVNLAEPRLFGSSWDAGFNVFGFFLPGSDVFYRRGVEIPGEEIETRTSSASLFLGRPLGSYAKLDLTYRLSWEDFGRTDATAEDFVLPQTTFTHRLIGDLTYTRGGYRARLSGSYNTRQSWESWGLAGNDEFDPEQQDYLLWQASLRKTWWLEGFWSFSLEAEHLGGSRLDRFSKYDFGPFSGSSVAGYQGGLVRAEEANGLHASYGIDLGKLFQAKVEADAVWASDEVTGLDNELLGGVGVQGTVIGPWGTIINFEVGKAVAGPGDGIAVRAVFLKLYG